MLPLKTKITNQPPVPKPIAICVDDFGMHPAVNAAVLELIERKRVTTTTVMVGGSAVVSGANDLRRCTPGSVEIGLHLDFTAYPTYLQDFKGRLGRLIQAAYLKQLNAVLVAQEIATQLDQFEQHFHCPPAFVDGHQHIHQLPSIRDALLQQLTQRYADQMPWIRRTEPPGVSFDSTLAFKSSLKAKVIGFLGAKKMNQLMRQASINGNTRMLGVYGESISLQTHLGLMHSWLASTTGGELLMTHAANAVISHDDFYASRVQEYELLKSNDFGQILVKHGIELRPIKTLFLA
jgi:chitin disaccharide deacetylase